MREEGARLQPPCWSMTFVPCSVVYCLAVSDVTARLLPVDLPCALYYSNEDPTVRPICLLR